MSGSNKVAYIPGSYKTIGQDGNHFNKSVNYSSNSSAPDSVVDALYYVSDHLPVSMSLKINAKQANINNIETNSSFTVSQNESNLFITAKHNVESKNIQVICLLGDSKCNIFKQSLNKNNTITVPTDFLEKGIYILKIYHDMSVEVKKFYKI